MIKKQYFKEMKSRIKSIVGVFLTVEEAKVNIYSFWVATLTLAAGDGLKLFIPLMYHKGLWKQKSSRMMHALSPICK